MKAWEVLGYTYEDGYALCVECAGHNEKGSSGTIFVSDEVDGMTCDECHEPISPTGES